MKKDLTSKDILAIRCPICGAAPGVRCEVGTRQRRAEPHRDRRLIAAEKSGSVAAHRKTIITGSL